MYPEDPNEALRLVSIDDLFERIPQTRLEQITSFARKHFGVDSCFVTLIQSDRQLIMSGGDEPSETPRDVSFCTHTILDHEVMVVPDARRDQRFKDNPSVTGEPFVRFYAGAPLRYAPLTSDAEVRLGALCLVDHRPRTLFPEEKAELIRLAEEVVAAFIAAAFNTSPPELRLEEPLKRATDLPQS